MSVNLSLLSNRDFDINVLKEAYKIIPAYTMPILNETVAHLKKARPYSGLNIVHNLHITYSTICKIIPLLYSGANLTVTATNELQVDDNALELIKKANVTLRKPEDLEDNFDISLDCGAGLLKYVTPKIGAVEITQSGTAKYQEANITFPVISVDSSNTKKLETFFGTGDGFVRALQENTNNNLTGKKIILFGYGKVGHGIVYALQQHTKNIVIVEFVKEKIEQAREDGYVALSFADTTSVKDALQGAFCAVTATGVPKFVSTLYTEADFINCKYLANMGTEDEFGDSFSGARVLFNKAPINFSIKIPTLSKYLDPIFYAHNAVIDLLLSGNFSNGFHALPLDFDLQLLARWESIHQPQQDGKHYTLIDLSANQSASIRNSCSQTNSGRKEAKQAGKIFA